MAKKIFMHHRFAKLITLFVVIGCMAFCAARQIQAASVTVTEMTPDPASLQASTAKIMVNRIRKANGLPDLQFDERLVEPTKTRAKEQALRFDHIRPDGSQWYTAAPDLLYGENLAEGFKTAESVVNAWMNSKSHRENILRTDIQSMDIEVYIAPDGHWYWAMELY